MYLFGEGRYETDKMALLDSRIISAGFEVHRPDVVMGFCKKTGEETRKIRRTWEWGMEPREFPRESPPHGQFVVSHGKPGTAPGSRPDAGPWMR